MGRQAATRSNPVYRLRAVSSGDVEEQKALLPGKAGAASNRSSRVACGVCALMTLLFLGAFALGLEGGSHSRDLQYINAHLTEIGALLATAVAAFTVAAWSTVAFGPQHAWLAWPVRWGLLAALLAFLAYDHGGDFQYHGFYNFVVFVLIALPLNLVLLGLWLWYSAMSPQSFAMSFVGAGATVLLVVVLALAHYKRMWFHGLLGRSMAVGGAGTSAADCAYVPNLPWVDLLPAGAQNFWTGSQHCKATQHFDAEFSDEGLLTIRGCHHPDDMSYTELPDTRRWGKEWKTHDKAAYQTHVMEAMEPEKYSQPIKLASEAVLAKCGKEERLLVRVAPLRSRAAPEAPLTTLLERPGGGSSSRWGSSSKKRKPAGAAKSLAEAADAADAAGAAGAAGAAAGAAASDPAAKGRPKLNVMVLFLDSVSRRHFFRRMLRTAAALEGISRRGQAGLYQFFRYHTVGFSTDPNTHALYTGTSFPNPRAMPVWEAYRKAGYVSGSAYNLCEDWGTDYNEEPAFHDHELVAPFCDPEYHPVTPDGEPYQMFKGAFSILRRCLRGRHVHEYNFDYARSFLRAYSGATPYFFINSFHEGHEGTGEVLKTMDGDTADFLEELTPQQLNSTLVILLADHGLTMGLNFLFTQNGRVEHKNPFMAMLAPPWLPQAFPELAAALRSNEQRLVSAYDIHTTLHHVLRLGDKDAKVAAAAARGGEDLQEQYLRWGKAGNVSEAVRWGISLLAPIPPGRTCEQAHIPADNCMCVPLA